jgi:hypothetical protein
MSQKPYEAWDAPTTRPADHHLGSLHLRVAFVGSIILVLLGLATAGLAMLPSDAPDFFLLSGLHLIASGMLGVICVWGQLGGPVGYLLSGTCAILNAALVVRIAMLLIDTTLRGPLIVVAPMLIAVPATVNVLAAVLNLRRKRRRNR